MVGLKKRHKNSNHSRKYISDWLGVHNAVDSPKYWKNQNYRYETNSLPKAPKKKPANPFPRASNNEEYTV